MLQSNLVPSTILSHLLEILYCSITLIKYMKQVAISSSSTSLGVLYSKCYLPGFLKPFRLPTIANGKGMNGSGGIVSSHLLLGVRVACLEGKDSLTRIQIHQP